MKDYLVKLHEKYDLDPEGAYFQEINLHGKSRIYATRYAADQLRVINGISTRIVRTELIDGKYYTVEVEATELETGRTHAEIGCADITRGPLKGENSFMLAMTRANRRATLAILGIPALDEEEISSIKGAPKVEQVEEAKLVEATDKQIGFIRANLGLLTEEQRARTEEALSKGLTKGMASQYIKRLNELKGGQDK